MTTLSKKQTPLYDKNGNFGGVAITMNPMGEGEYDKDAKVYVYGKDNQLIGVFDGINGAMKAGLSPYNRPEGRGRRGGAGAGGVAGTGGSGRYKLSDTDMKAIGNLATTKNPDTGEETFDIELAALLETMMRQEGYSPFAAKNAYTKNLNGALAQGATPEQARKFALEKMEAILNQRRAAQNGGQQPQAAQKTGQQPQAGASAQEQPVSDAKKAKDERILQAAGSNGASAAKGAIPPELARSDPRAAQISPYKMQDGAYRMMQGIGALLTQDPGEPEEDPWEYRP